MTKVTTSLEIAEETGKTHANVKVIIKRRESRKPKKYPYKSTKVKNYRGYPVEVLEILYDFNNIEKHIPKGNTVWTKKKVEDTLIKEERNIKLLSKTFTFASATYNFKCTVHGCGYEWPNSWKSINVGHGCPKCAGNLKLTYEGILLLMKDNPKYENKKLLSTSFKRARDPLNWECLVCGNLWPASWDTIHNGEYGCEECGKKKGNTEGGYNNTNANRKKEEWLNIPAIIYTLACWDVGSNEVFYKQGITKHKVKQRFHAHSCLPYNYIILEEIKTNLYDSVYMEEALHSFSDEFRTRAKIDFYGRTECFTQLIPYTQEQLDDKVKELKEEYQEKQKNKK